eukprot:c5007_g2_i1 orf=213-419(+)
MATITASTPMEFCRVYFGTSWIMIFHHGISGRELVDDWPCTLKPLAHTLERPPGCSCLYHPAAQLLNA